MTRLRNDQLSGAVGDFVRMAALGATDAADLQRLACDLLGIPQPERKLPPYDFADLADRLRKAYTEQPDTLTCEDYAADDEPEPEVESLNLPSFQTYDAHRHSLGLTPAELKAQP